MDNIFIFIFIYFFKIETTGLTNQALKLMMHIFPTDFMYLLRNNDLNIVGLKSTISLFSIKGPVYKSGSCLICMEDIEAGPGRGRKKAY